VQLLSASAMLHVGVLLAMDDDAHRLAHAVTSHVLWDDNKTNEQNQIFEENPDAE
jgi:hypothetical protein